MITEENLNKLYQGVIEGKKLTTKELNSYGFNSKDLKKLIDEGKLERVKIGLYQFLDSGILFALGKEYINMKDFDKADLCFEKCYQLDNSNMIALYAIFKKSIQNKNYSETIQYYEILSSTNNPYYKQEYNLYLHLLNTITDLPKKHQEQAKRIRLADIILFTNDRRYKSVLSQNNIRKSIINKNFTFALHQLNDLTRKHQENTIYDVVLRSLLIEAIEKQKLETKKILQLTQDKKYQEIINFLNLKKQKENLSITEKSIINLSETIIYIKKSKKIPTKNIENTDNIYEAIYGNNYELALKINIDNSIKYNLDNTNNIIYILLNEISNLTKEILNEKKQTEENEKIESLNKVNITFSDIISYLYENNIEASSNKIKEYLKLQNKQEYEFLITNLIKISILEQDVTYSKAILVLINININNYNFDLSNYIEEFYLAISKKRFEVAKVYLNIINNAKKLGQECAFTDNLSKILEKSEETIDKKIVLKQETKTDPFVEPKDEVKTEQKKNDEIKPPTKKEQQQTCEIKDSEREFIETKYQKLLIEKGAILLKEMDSARRKAIYRIVDNYPDMVAFSIGTGENKQIVLRYKPYIDEYVALRKLIKDGNEAYTNKNYDKCIDCYLKVLSFGTPKTFAYASLGLAYMKKFNIDKAVEYLTIATKLAKENNEEYDFTELIYSLTSAPDPEKKPKFTMHEKEFSNDVDDYYGIDNFDEINNYIIESGLDVDSACNKLNMNDEQRTRIKLLYAKLYYSQGEYDLGDIFLHTVEKNNNKSNFIKKQIEEVKRTKKFYINREDTSIKKLSLNLKPKK